MNRIAQQVTRLSEEDQRWIVFEIGVALLYEWAPPGVSFSAPYERIGKELWDAVQFDLYKQICDPKKKAPSYLVDELVSGDIRELATGILTILVSQLSIPSAIAIPIAALTIKLGLRKFCALTPKRPKRSYLEILARMKGNAQGRSSPSKQSKHHKHYTFRNNKKSSLKRS